MLSKMDLRVQMDAISKQLKICEIVSAPGDAEESASEQ